MTRTSGCGAEPILTKPASAVRGVIFDLFDTLVPFSAHQWDDLTAEMAGALAPAVRG